MTGLTQLRVPHVRIFGRGLSRSHRSQNPLYLLKMASLMESTE